MGILSGLIFCLGFLGTIFSRASAYTWPDPKTDFLEALYYQQIGYNELQFGVVVRTCAFGDNLVGRGRTNAAEWLRTAYHDMATADVEVGTGGLDASISFELERPENVGKAFLDTLNSFLPFMSTSTSMADLIALGTTMSISACTIAVDHKPVFIPLRGGRIDATGPGPAGVPQPHESLASHMASFKKQGFNASEMIALVACGHTLGGVNGVDFPEVVPALNDTANTESKQNFDGTIASFDNSVATQFMENTTQNALAFGHNETTRSDFRIFTSDGKDVIRKMAASNDFYLTTCSGLLQRMLETVPSGVELSDVIDPVPLKPDNIEISIDANGNMTIAGELRLLEDGGAHNYRQVLVYLKQRLTSDASTYPVIVAEKWQNVNGLYPYSPTFSWWKFSTTVPIQQGVSSFTVEVKDTNNSTEYSNGGRGFPLETNIIPQAKLSCASRSATAGYNLNVTAAVLDNVGFDSVSLVVPIPVEQTGSVVPRFETTTIEMQRTQTLGTTGYSLYMGTLKVTDKKVFFVTMSYGLKGNGEVNSVEIPFRQWKGLKAC